MAVQNKHDFSQIIFHAESQDKQLQDIAVWGSQYN